MKKKHIKQEKAITLVALVLTIIVLMILAGVSIAVLTGENGILTQANEAAKRTRIAQDKESLEMLKLELQLKKASGEISNGEFLEKFKELLEKDPNFKNATITIEDGTIKVVTKEGETYIVTEDKIKHEGNTEGNTTGGNTTGGNTTGGNTTGGNTTEGNTTEGNTTGGNTTEGNTTGGNTTEGNTTEGNTTGGNTTGGNTTGGNTTGGNTTGGDQTGDTIPELTNSNTRFTCNPELAEGEWTKEPIEVTIETDETGYTLQYTQDLENEESWKDYTGPASITQNGTIYARLKNSKGKTGDSIAGPEIKRIDTQAPTNLTFMIDEDKVTSHTITIKGIADDEESGIAYYQFSINGEAWKPEGGTTEGNYTFTNLTQETRYQFKMKAVDKVGREAVSETITGTTIKVPDLQTSNVNFEYSTTEPTRGPVLVTISTTVAGVGTNYQLQYTTQDPTKEESWKDYTSSVSMTENGSIYARLRDKSNPIQGGKIYATANITNIDKEGPTITSLSAEDISSNSITIVVEANDKTGIEEYQYYLGDILKETSNRNAYTFKNLTTKEKCTLKVKAKDTLGNESDIKTIEATPNKSINELQAGEYVNYVDNNNKTRKCVVLYDSTSSYGVQILTMTGVEDITFGNSSLQGYDAMQEYNSSRFTLNTAARKYINTIFVQSARCLGSLPDAPDSGDYIGDDLIRC